METLGEPIPGEPVTVEVTQGGSPASGVRVLFEGDPVGVTNQSGRVTGVVPYTPNLTIELRPDDTSISTPAQQTALEYAVSANTNYRHDDDRLYALVIDTDLLSLSQKRQVAATNLTWEVPVETNVTITIEGRPYPTNEVTLNATIAGHPIPDAVVRRNGTRIGTTSANGTVRLTIPPTTSDAVLVKIRKQAITDQRVITVSELEMRVRGRGLGGLLLPGQQASVTIVMATSGSAVPVTGPLEINGHQVAQFDGESQATVTLPMSNSAQFNALEGVATTTVSGLFVTVGSLIIAALALFAGLWRGYRYRETVRAIVSQIGNRFLVSVRKATQQIISLVRSLWDRLRQGIRKLPRYIKQVRRWVAQKAVIALRVTVGWLTTISRRLINLVLGLPRRLLMLPSVIFSEVFARESRGNGNSREASESGPHLSANALLRKFWRFFVKTVNPPRPETLTPVEIAQYAINKGAPVEPTQGLLEAYRRVTYGKAVPVTSNRNLTHIRRAWERIRRTVTDDDGDRDPQGGEKE